MQIELLKNKKTNIVEKLIISYPESQVLKNIKNLNLTHEDSMILLSALEIKWYKVFVENEFQKNRVLIMKEAQKDFSKNRELNFLLNYFFDYQEKHEYQDETNCWFSNYYFWVIFYITMKGLGWNHLLEVEETPNLEYMPVFDPMILFFLEGKEYAEDYDLLTSDDRKLLMFIFNLNLEAKPDELFAILKSGKVNNANVNLLILEKEILLKNQFVNKNNLFWLLKKKALGNYLVEAIQHKIHYL